ncbi:alpha/beta hydrolase [Lactovum odontotermitis]
MNTHYLYRSGDSNLAPVLLLHGTGGDETELLPLAEMILPNHPVLAIRGRVSENGHPRYFERYAEGLFNLESLAAETDWLYEELQELAGKFEMDINRMIVIGYSNGANIALHMALSKPVKFAAIVGHHAMQLTKVPVQADQLAQTNIFLTYAENDFIVSAESFAQLTENLRAAGADLSIHRENSGHQLTRSEALAARNYLQKK